MRINDILKLSFRNVLSGKIKSILCALAVCVGITSICLVMEIGSNAENQISGELSQISNNMISLSSKENEKFSLQEIKEIETISRVKGVMPYVFEYGSYFAKTNSFPAVICGVTEKITDIFNITLLYGRLPTKNEVKSSSRVAIVDDIMANNMYGRTNIVGKEIKLAISNEIKKYEIIGVISSQKSGIENMVGQHLPELIYIPYTGINEVYGENMVDKIAISCFADGDANEIGAKIVRKLEINDSSKGYFFDNISTYRDTALKITGILSMLISAIAGISVLVGGIGIMNSLVASCENRKSEIGIYMALGARPWVIAVSFICEAIIISIIGGTIGILISCTAVTIGNNFISIPISINFFNIVVSFIGSIFCGALFGYLPARKASKLNPIEAIRWE